MSHQTGPAGDRPLGFPIHPDHYYTERDLQLGLGMTAYAQDHERKTGRLKHAKVGGPDNGTVVYRGKHVIEMLANAGLA